MSPWIVLGTAAILIVVVLALAAQNIRRDRRHMSQLLTAKSEALIRAVEAGTRTGAGMMGMMRWGGPQVQRLLEETAQLSDVLYMAVISPEGRILAHSDTGQIGRLFRPGAFAPPSDKGVDGHWEIVTDQQGRHVFETRRLFRPLPPNWKHKRRPGGAMGGYFDDDKSADDWFDSQITEPQTIVIGLDAAPFQRVITDGIRNTLVLSFVLLLSGLAGFLSLFWMHNYRLARRSLRDTSAFADEVVSSLPVGLIATDRDGNIAFFNAAAQRISGIASQAAMGRKPEEILPAQLCGLKDRLDRGTIIREEEMLCPFGNGQVPLSVSAARIVNIDNEVVGRIIILRDLAEVYRLQAEIRRQEKLAALGGLAAGVAHEIRNPLSSIKGLATYFGEKFAPDSEDRKLSRVMIQEVDRLNRVISELLEFARPTDLKRRPYDINGLLEHCLQLVQQEAAEKAISVEIRLSGTLCQVFVDPDRLSQCILNLYLNAIEAMAAGGRLTVVSEPMDGSRIRVQISDNGSGIKAEDLEQIFNPYFTTKSKGTGLGLAIVHKIIEAHDGHIQVASAPGEGTRFTLILSCVQEGQEET